MGPRLEPGAPETKGEKLPHTAPRECGRHPAEAKMTLQVKDKHTQLCSTQKFSNTNKDVGLSQNKPKIQKRRRRRRISGGSVDCRRVSERHWHQLLGSQGALR